MHAITAIISALGMSIWDLGVNHGEFTRLALAAASHFVRMIGI